MSRRTRAIAASAACSVACSLLVSASASAQAAPSRFNRVATFEVTTNPGSKIAEIVAAADGGRTLLYSDADAGLIGFVDISDPAAPTAAGTLVTGGAPTSVAIAGSRALVAVDDTVTEGDGTFGPHAGRLLVVDLATRAVVRTINTGGQPDSVKVGPTGKFAVVAIENQRDEAVAGGIMPHVPANGAERSEPGFVTIVNLAGAPAAWTTRNVSLTGLAGMKFNTDPEPEFVDINANEMAVVSLQENNHLVVIELRSGLVIRHWSAGSVANQVADTSETPLDIVFNGSISVAREPDAVAWIQNGGRILTADEGDYEGGSRSFTLVDLNTFVAGASGPGLELQNVRHGHYVESRSANKGIEPEGVAVGTFGGQELFFVGSERANSVGVYRLVGNTFAFQQLLPTGVSPEGLLPIGTRNLFVTANEVEGTLSIFRYEAGPAKYPTILSVDSATKGAIPGTSSPIPWGALSALAADRTAAGRLFTVHDSAYANSRIYSVDATSAPARIVDVTDIKGISSESWDLEGIATRPTQAGTGFWLASEGNANANAAPAVRLNHLLRVAPDGTVLSEVPLPPIAGATPTSNGFEGVTAVWNAAQSREEVFVAIQRSWDGTSWTRIARYVPSTNTWDFAAYPLDAGSSVGLSEIVAVGPDQYAVIERDNQGGPTAVVKRIYRFSVAGYSFVPISSSADPALVAKVLVNDLLDELRAPRGRVIEKVEGLTVDAAGQTFLNTDNDAEDGESQFFRLGPWVA